VPQSVLSLDRLRSLVPVPIAETAWDDLLFASKAELEGQDGDALTLSVTPDRLDLLSEGGLALYLAGVLDAAQGLPPTLPRTAGPPSVTFEVDRSVDPLRPCIAGALVRAPADGLLDADLLEEAVRFQEILHATIGRDRRAASLGIYPWERLEGPIRYAAEPVEGLRLVPLDGEEEVTGSKFFSEHPYAARYGALGRSGDRCLVLRDHAGTVLSLPPILNARAGGEARPGDRSLLLESTGLEERTVRDAVGLLLVVFAARGWEIEPVAVRRAGAPVDPGAAVVTPRPVDLPSELLRSITGEALASAEVERRLSRSRLSPHPADRGWRVDVPPWRPDLLTPVDLAEDVVIAAALPAAAGIVPPSRTRGRRLAEGQFRRAIAVDLLGLGLAAPYTPLLVSEEVVARLGEPRPLRLRNPVSNEFAYLRDRLLLSHLGVLAHNTRHAYPQRFGEVGPVVMRDPTVDSGGRTRYHAGLVLAADGAGFAEAAALVDYLLRRLDVGSVREPVGVPGMIPGRSARCRVAGEPVAEIGELDPAILTAIGVPVPTAWAEVDLTALWPLARRSERP